MIEREGANIFIATKCDQDHARITNNITLTPIHTVYRAIQMVALSLLFTTLLDYVPNDQPMYTHIHKLSKVMS